MRTTIISSRDFNQATSQAKRAAEDGPVIITDRGRPSHVLLSYAAFEELRRAGGRSVLDALAQKEPGDFPFDPPRAGDDLFRPAKLD